MLSEWWVRHNFRSIGTSMPVIGLSSHCLHTYIDLLDLNVLVPNCCNLPVILHSLCYVRMYGYVIGMYTCELLHAYHW